MALHALDRMGADAARLQRFFDAYASRFATREPSERAATALDDWLPHRGHRASLPALRATFAKALQRADAATVLCHAVPHLMPGVGAAAFHGLLRTAHAFEAGHLGELAHGLAYWAACWFQLGPGRAMEALLGFDDWSARLAHEALGWQSRGALISQRMREAERAPAYRELADSLRLENDTLAQLAGFAAGHYAQTAHFTALHLVTGSHAARVMLPFAGDAFDASRSLVRAYTAAFLASGVAHAERSTPHALLDAPALVAGAIASDDDHGIKLVDACLEETAFYGDRRHRQAASRALIGATA